MITKTYFEKDYMKVYSENGYIYIEDTYTDTNVALNDGDFDGVIGALEESRKDADWRRLTRKEAAHVADGKVVF